MTDVTLGRQKLEVVPSFCYLGTAYPQVGDVNSLLSSLPCRMGKFNDLLPVLTSRLFSITSRGRVYNVCVRRAVLHASEIWAPTSSGSHRLQRNDQAMVPWMCGVTTKEQVSSQDLLEQMQLDDLAKVLHTRLLRWYGRWYNVAMVGGRKSRNSIPKEVVAVAALSKPGQKWSTWTV